MQAHELFIGVQISLARTGEQDRFALGRLGQNCKLYTVRGKGVPARTCTAGQARRLVSRATTQIRVSEP
jgi:hypothetical protein